MSDKLIKTMLAQQAEVDSKIQNRTFGQPAALPENSSTSDIHNVVEECKTYISRKFGTLILDPANRANPEFVKQLHQAILTYLENDGTLSRNQRMVESQRILDDILGFGPIQDLLEDPEVTEIMVSRWDRVYAERNGKLMLVPDVKFNSDDHLYNIINKIVQNIGRKIDESTPLVDARLPDGSRVNATIKPISPDGATLTIRKFAKHKLTGEDYLRFGSLSPEMLEFLKQCVIARCNIIVSGGTGSGKTTLLNMLSNYIPDWEAIVTIEDSCELQLGQENVRRLEVKPPNAEGKGAVTIQDLVKNALRMRPDRIVVGEIRDGTVVDMFRAMSSGHDGSLTTIHANNPRDLCEATLPILFGYNEEVKLSEHAQRLQIVSSVDLIVQIARLRDGSRKITNITHVVGLGKDGASKLSVKEENIDPNKIYLQDIFKYNQRTQRFEATGYVPKNIVAKIEQVGGKLDPKIFKKEDAANV